MQGNRYWMSSFLEMFQIHSLLVVEYNFTKYHLKAESLKFVKCIKLNIKYISYIIQFDTDSE